MLFIKKNYICFNMNLFKLIQSGLRLRNMANKTGMFAIFSAALFGGLLIWLLTSGYNINEVLCNRGKHTGLWTTRDLLSNSSIYSWGAALLFSVIAFFVKNKYTPQWTSFFVYTGFISLFFMLDDYLLIPSVYVHPWICYAFYCLLGFFFILRHYKEIIEVNPFAFSGTIGLLLLSVTTNLLHTYFPWSPSISLILIAGPKFMATLLWLYFIINGILAALQTDGEKKAVESSSPR